MATVPSLDRFQAQPKREMSGQVFELARALKSVPELADADLSLSLGDAGDYAGNPPASRLISVAGPVMPFGWLSGVCRTLGDSGEATGESQMRNVPSFLAAVSLVCGTIRKISDPKPMPKDEITSDQRTDGNEPSPSKPLWLERQSSVPFHELTGEQFEEFCCQLLQREHPNDRIHRYGRTGDAGRDIIRESSDSATELIQCKRYTRNVGVTKVREELAKLFTNVFSKEIRRQPQKVSFYIVPDLTAKALDVLSDRDVWVQIAQDALAAHLNEQPQPELLTFAKTWWPDFSYQTARDLAERSKSFPELLEEFFAVKKVTDASRDDLRQIVRTEMEPLLENASTTHQSVTVNRDVIRSAHPTSKACFDRPWLLSRAPKTTHGEEVAGDKLRATSPSCLMNRPVLTRRADGQ